MSAKFLLPGAWLMACAVSGCGTVGEQVFADPSRYTVYQCSQVEAEMKAFQYRVIELEQLMKRASQDTGGEVVNLIAYRTEYLQNKSRVAAAAQAAAEKKCATESEFISRRSIY